MTEDFIGDGLSENLESLGPLAPLNGSTTATDEVGSGGQGVVRRLVQYMLPDAPGPLVYKEYRHRIGVVSAHGLERLIRFRQELPEDQRQWLDSVAAWPVRTVVVGGAAAGVIMRHVPEEFYHELPQVGGPRALKERDSQWLFVDERICARAGVTFANEMQRLYLCETLAYLLAFLHKRDIVFGDISATNILFRLIPSPGLMVVDCDAVRKVGTAAVVGQLHSPDWDPPERQSGAQTKKTDVYKLGLYVLRALTPGRYSSVDRDPFRAGAALGPAGLELLKLSLSDQPARRPEAAVWLRYLRERTGRGRQT